MVAKAQTVHKRAWVGGWAVTYCDTSLPSSRKTSSDDLKKVNCQRCLAVAGQSARVKA